MHNSTARPLTTAAEPRRPSNRLLLALPLCGALWAALCLAVGAVWLVVPVGIVTALLVVVWFVVAVSAQEVQE